MSAFVTALALGYLTAALLPSGVAHLARFGAFRAVVRAHGVVPNRAAAPVALLVAVAEIGLGAAAAVAAVRSSAPLGPPSQAGAAFAALVVTWVAVVLLVLVVAHLHARLRRLEQADWGRPDAAGLRAPPYAGLIGRSLTDLVGQAPVPRVLLVLSAGCSSCQRLLADLADPSWSIPTVLAWSDGTPGGDLPVPALPDGPRVAAALGVRVIPFGLVSDDDGHVVWAGPVTGLNTLADRVRPAHTRSPATGVRQP